MARARSRSVLITCKVPVELVEVIDMMVKNGVFSSRSEAIRYAIGFMVSSGTPIGRVDYGEAGA